MSQVTVSPKYQVVIPKQVREKARLEPGQKIDVFFYNGQIRMVPVRPAEEMRGFLEGIDTTISRDEDRV